MTRTEYATHRADAAIEEAARDDDHSLYTHSVSLSDQGLNSYGEAIYAEAYDAALHDWDAAARIWQAGADACCGDAADKAQAGFDAVFRVDMDLAEYVAAAMRAEPVVVAEAA